LPRFNPSPSIVLSIETVPRGGDVAVGVEILLEDDEEKFVVELSKCLICFITFDVEECFPVMSTDAPGKAVRFEEVICRSGDVIEVVGNGDEEEDEDETI
jgi:hypothetical protein